MLGPKGCATVLLLITMCAGPALAQDKAKQNEKFFPGIIGEDNREIIDTWDPPWNVIGRVNVAGFRSRSMCSGTLVSSRMVITAAHCLYNARTGKSHVPSTINFVAGVRRDQYVAHANAACVYTLDGYKFTSRPTLKQATQDVGVIVLSKPLDLNPFPVLKQLPTTKTKQSLKLTSAGYARDRPYLLAADKNCKLLQDRGNLWLTNCDTNYGGSGGPVLVKEEGALKLAAIMVASAQNKFSIAVPKNVWSHLLDKTTCPKPSP
ncbi:trypsin-like serine protease [Pseudovibrio sp. Tun.PSC04-5.I4]|uniref:trypsin-like serine peptidase n=1 Tax=Pseudovibrio sp. Tun.PSC04-5.I4 TaxID=1798213 RepID=UPI000891FAED|nr:trypsin-like serine protease [Pseudovibrio sp. Tun.PSC04-5.I4]SDQ86727.1 protease YdgD [Pseudovibrio sp. Tun.PSC04-5.I4]